MIPLASPVAGHGCVSWNSRLTEADLCSLAEADNGINDADGERGENQQSEWNAVAEPRTGIVSMASGKE